jgi:hypothetical protein
MLQRGALLKGDYWPEPVRILAVEHLGTRVRIEAVGIKSSQVYERILSATDLERVRVVDEAVRDFSARGEAFFLAMEAHRIRYAHQFDPLFAVSVAQVDPLPHQIEAVYHYILRNPRIRFLLSRRPRRRQNHHDGLAAQGTEVPGSRADGRSSWSQAT